MKTEILKDKCDWSDVVDAARSTVNKPPLGKEPSEKFKRYMIIAEHSPIRSLVIRWKWSNIKSWISVHFSRHKFEKWITTQRNDRQKKYDRNKAPQDSPVDFIGEANAQNLIDTARKRLCFQASPETREYMEDLKVVIHRIEPEIADACVSNCIYRSGCCEGENNCHFYENFLKRHPEITAQTTIVERYNIYNKEFYEKHPYTVEMENNENG